MKKLTVGVLVLTLLIPTPAHAASVKFKNQKSGQFCAKKDMSKEVTLPNSSVLVCSMDGAKHRWKPKGAM